jgi:arylsulfatase A-like enzyme
MGEMRSSSQHARRNLVRLLALMVAFGMAACGAPEHSARLRLDDLLVGKPRFRVLTPGEAPPRLELALPGVIRSEGGQSMPALLLAPGARVEFMAEPQGQEFTGQLRLVGSLAPAGESAQLLAQQPHLVLVAQIYLAGKLVLEQRYSGADTSGWREIVGSDGRTGLELEPGTEIQFACQLEGTRTEPVGPTELRLAIARLALAADAPCRLTKSSPAAPNLILVLSDTLRADFLSCHGHPKEITPNIDALARRGVRFENAYSTAPWTWPSTASLFTGAMPSAHGVVSSYHSDLSSSHVTLAESLALGGLRTAAICGNPLIVPEHNYDQGFETFVGTQPGIFLDAPELMPQAIDWIEKQGEQRFFLYLHLVDAHEPHDWLKAAEKLFPGLKPAGYPDAGLVQMRANLLRKRATFTADGRSRLTDSLDPTYLRFARVGYQRAIWTQDQWIGELLASLREQGLEDRTLVAFTSDHGEEFLEHGGILHGDSLFEELVHVPLILAGPGIPAGTLRSQPVSNRHLAGTLGRLMGVPFGGSAEYDLLMDSSPADVRFEDETVRWHDQKDLPVFGARMGGQVLLHAPTAKPWGQGVDDPPAFELSVFLAQSEGLGDPGRSRLYDLALDPGQQRDLAADLDPAELSAQVLALLQAFERDGRLRPASFNQLGADVEAMLIDMGYLPGPEAGPEEAEQVR